MFNELNKILQYIVEKLSTTNLASKYSQLAQLYEQARTSPSGAVTEQIEQLKKDIVVLQHDVEPTSLDQLSVRIFYKFDQDGVLGIRGITKTLDDLAALGIDPHGASTILQQTANKITELQNQAKNALTNLKNVLSEPEETPDGMQKFQVIFEGGVAVENFSSLQAQATDWELILKIASQIFPDGQPEAKLTAIYKASPAVVIVIAPEHVVLALCGAAYFALQIKQKMLEIKKLELEIEKQELENTKLILDNVKDQEERKLASEINKATKELLKRLKEEIGELHINVAEIAAKLIIKKLYNFSVKGGEVSLVDGNANGERDEVEVYNLNRRYKEIRHFEKELDSPKLLLTGIKPEELEMVTGNMERQQRSIINDRSTISKKNGSKDKSKK